MSLISHITIDGPSASGKSSVCIGLSKKLGWTWLSTGAFYRGLAYVALEERIPLDDEAGLVKLEAEEYWFVQAEEEKTSVIYKGQDVSEFIYREDMGQFASKIGQFPAVRACLLDRQRSFLKLPGLVAEGRDCGTVVFPDAPLKVYLTASLEKRVSRRENQESGTFVGDLMKAQKKRDKQDSGRAVAPLKVALGGVEIDSSEMTLEETIDKIYALWVALSL